MQSFGTPSIAIRAVKKVNSLKIGWVAPFDLNAAQTRIRVINIHRRLISIGWDSKIITFENAVSDYYDIVIVGKDFSENALNSIQQIKAKNSYVVADICEDLIDLNIPYYKEIISISNMVISASEHLTTRLKKINPNTITIQDAVETDLALNCAYVDRPLKVVSIGYGGKSHLTEEMRYIIESCGMTLCNINEWMTADIIWDRNTWVSHALNCDIALTPQNPEQPSKSNNRCTQMMALGLPVVTTHHPAYEPLIKDNCGFFYDDEYDKNAELQKEEKLISIINRPLTEQEKTNILHDVSLTEILNILKDKNIRQQIGQNGKAKCTDFTIPAITDNWINLFKELQKKVDIIIATYNNLPYLKLTIESIKQCTTYPYEIYVVDSGSDDTHQYCLDNNIPIFYSEKRLTFAEANNIGIQNTNNYYICLLNNDIIVSHNWLQHLVKGTEQFDLVGPLSNCDKYWQHELSIIVDNVSLEPNMKISDFENIESLYNVQGMNQYYQRDWVAFYCTLGKREVINQIGLLDEGYRNNAEDVDLCKRANLLGYTCGQNYNSFVFHFGGKTRKVSEDENYTQHHIENNESSIYYRQKYEKETVVIWQGPSFVPWDDRNLETGNIGGSEVWTIHLAREFDKLGYTVKIFNDCSNKSKYFGNIEYLHWTEFGRWNDMNYIHYFISSRSLEPFKLNIRAREKYCMVHDMFIMLNSPDDIQYHTKVDKFFCLSTKHKEFLSEHHKIDSDRILITSNGIDFERFKDVSICNKDRYKVIYTSSPDRGLENLLNMWDEIKKRIPLLKLDVYYGFDWIKDKQWVDMMISRMRDLGVHYHGKVNQYELADAFMTSRVFTAPNWFSETFCIGALECMISGCVYLGSAYWGLLDTVKDSGVLIPMENAMDCTTPNYHALFINELEELINNDVYYNRIQYKGFERVKRFSWSNVALQWHSWFQKKEWTVIQNIESVELKKRRGRPKKSCISN